LHENLTKTSVIKRAINALFTGLNRRGCDCSGNVAGLRSGRHFIVGLTAIKAIYAGEKSTGGLFFIALAAFSAIDRRMLFCR